jgi:hypothetical protein
MWQAVLSGIRRQQSLHETCIYLEHIHASSIQIKQVHGSVLEFGQDSVADVLRDAGFVLQGSGRRRMLSGTYGERQSAAPRRYGNPFYLRVAMLASMNCIDLQARHTQRRHCYDPHFISVQESLGSSTS